MAGGFDNPSDGESSFNAGLKRASWPGDLQVSQLELLRRLADAGSLSAAARRLHVTPAAASAALKRLEELAGTRRVERSTRSMRLTAQGESLLRHADAVLALLDEAKGELHAGQERLEGDVHVAAPSDLGRTLLVPMLDDFLDRHPGVRLALHLTDTLHDLLCDPVDLALRYGDLPDSSLVARRLHVTRRLAVTSPAYLVARGTPRMPAELAGHETLALYLGGRAQLRWPFWHEDAADGAPPDTTIEVQVRRHASDGAPVRQWALDGHGIACTSALDMHADLVAGRLMALLPGWHGGRFPLHAVLPPGRRPTARVRRLLDVLAAHFAALDASDDGSGNDGDSGDVEDADRHGDTAQPSPPPSLP